MKATKGNIVHAHKKSNFIDYAMLQIHYSQCLRVIYFVRYRAYEESRKLIPL